MILLAVQADRIYIDFRQTRTQPTNAKGIDMTKNETIGRTVLVLVNGGMDIIEALKTVCGASAVEAMIDGVYEELRGSKTETSKTPAATVKFNKHNVTNTATKAKCRVFYSLDNRTDHRNCVTIYAKGCLDKLFPVFGSITQNDSDSMTDYFESDRVVLFEDHPLYATARAAVEAMRQVC